MCWRGSRPVRTWSAGGRATSCLLGMRNGRSARGGYYCLKSISENVKGFVQYQRGRSELSGTQLTLKPYGGDASQYEVDIFGTTLTLISTNSWSGQFTGYEEVPGSAAEVATKAAEAQAFLSNPDWQVGDWQIQKEDNQN